MAGDALPFSAKTKELYRQSGAEPWFLNPFMQVVAERVSEGV